MLLIGLALSPSPLSLPFCAVAEIPLIVCKNINQESSDFLASAGWASSGAGSSAAQRSCGRLECSVERKRGEQRGNRADKQTQARRCSEAAQKGKKKERTRKKKD